MENTEAIRQTLQDFRVDTLTRFMSEFVPLLRQEGYTFEDFLDAVTNWTHEQPGLDSVVKHLEQAREEVYHIQRIKNELQINS